MRRWAQIRGAFRLRRRNVSRIVAAMAAALLAFHTATAALSPADETLSGRTAAAMCRILNIKDSMPPSESSIAVSDHVFTELVELFILFRPLLSPVPAAPRWRKAMPTVGRAVLPVPSVCGFTAEDRRMLRQIHRASVFGETPTDAQVAGDVRRRQVLYGAKLYSRPTKYEKGLSAAKAAEKAIRAPQFRDVEGAYTLAEKSSLARAIIREHGSPRPDSAT